MRALGAALALAALACAPQRAADPFAAGGNRAGDFRDGRAYRVRLEVVCDGCLITYSIAGRSETGVGAPIWRATFDRYPRFPEAIRVTASGQVEHVRIYVDGTVVAEQMGDPGDRQITLTAEAVVPPPPDAPTPDTLRSGRAADPSGP